MSAAPYLSDSLNTMPLTTTRQEYSQILQAARDIDAKYRPKVTFVVCAKRVSSHTDRSHVRAHAHAHDLSTI